MNDQPSPPFTRADVVALLVALALPSLLVLVHFVLLAGASEEILRPVWGGTKVVQFALPAVWVLLIRRRRWIAKKPGKAGVLPGVLFGLIVGVGMVVLYYFWVRQTGYLSNVPEQLSDRLARYGVTSVAGYALFAVCASLVHSFLEEYYWRWFAFGGLRRLMPVSAAIVVSGLAFMAHHTIIMYGFLGGLSLATVGFSLAVAVGGGVWAWIYHRSGSLLGPWLSHLLIDAAMFLVGFDLVSGYLAG
jgi:membrane protease YdiL (CAAX protease family)